LYYWHEIPVVIRLKRSKNGIKSAASTALVAGAAQSLSTMQSTRIVTKHHSKIKASVHCSEFKPGGIGNRIFGGDHNETQ